MPVVPADGDAPVSYRGDPEVRIEPWATHDEDGFQVSRVTLGTHAGTHVDAPLHFVESGRGLEEFSLQEFHFEALQVDVTGVGPRTAIEFGDLPGRARDPPDEVGLLVIRAGWGERWGRADYFDHPYLHPSLVDHCVTEGLAVGVDFPSPDETATREHDREFDRYPAHERLLGNGLLIFENLAGLDAFPERRYEFRAYPLLLTSEERPGGIDGAPVRAVAKV